MADDERRLRPTRASTLATVWVGGLLLGGLVRPVVERAGGIAPPIGVLPAFGLGFLALLLGVLAWGTHRTLRAEPRRLEWNRAVNLLVLGAACAGVGALVSGAYLGYAYSFAGSWDTVLGQDRVLHGVLAGVAALAVCVAGALLERACRVPDDDEPGPGPGEPDRTSA